MNDVTALILAGGLGRRLRSVVNDRQKVVAEIEGRPFLSYLLEQIEAAGVGKAVLCTGYGYEQVREQIGQKWGRVQIEYSQESFAMGTAGALRHALSKADSDPILIMNGDSYFEVDLPAFLRWHKMHQSEATIALVERSDVKRYGCAKLDEASRIIHFDEKSSIDEAGWVNGGIYLISRKLLNEIPNDRAVSLEREVFPDWVSRHSLYGYFSRGHFLDIGVPEAFARAKEFFAKQTQVHEKAGGGS